METWFKQGSKWVYKVKLGMQKIEWKLDDLWPIEEFEGRFNELKGEIENIEKWWRRLDGEMNKEDFGKFLVWSEGLAEKMHILGGRPGLMEAVDVNDRKAKLMRAKLNELSLRMADETRKINHWLKGLPTEGKKKLTDEQARRLFGVIEDLEYGLWHSRRAAKHTLPQREEKIIDYKDTYLGEPLSELRELITTEFEFEMKVGKKIKKVKNQAQLLAYTHSSKADEREAAYRALLTKYGQNMDKLFAIYQGVVKDWGFEAKERGYSSPIAVRNFANDIPDEVIETVLEVTKDNRHIFWRYFKFKAKRLGLSKLKRWDVYAPLSANNKKFSWEEAVDLSLKAMEGFSPRFKSEAIKILNEGHVDVYPRKNKSSGAFCATISPNITPYVMLNFTGQARDVATLAHELGHGVHSLLANRHYPSSQHAPLPLAETASTLAEMLLFEEMYKKADKRTKVSMLSDKVADAYATILRQNYFVRFEIEAHNKIGSGIRADELSELYLSNLKEQFGNSVSVDQLYKNEWLYISHIFETPFYCYSYNFGELLALALFSKIKENRNKYITVIEKILTIGGSKDPILTLMEEGMDISKKDFWQSGFAIIEGWQSELERL